MLDPMILMTSLLFMLSWHPLILIIILIFLSFLMTTKFMFMMKISWVSYIFILMIVGGMMIMFIYMASLTPNEPKFIKIPTYMKIMAIPLLFTLLTMNSLPMKNLKFSTTSLSNPPLLLMFLVIYLLILLIILILIIPFNKGPLRS